jgi:hypothetical protein
MVIGYINEGENSNWMEGNKISHLKPKSKKHIWRQGKKGRMSEVNEKFNFDKCRNN